MMATFFRFLLVGVINTIIGLSAIFIFLNVLSVSYWFATFLGNGIGAVVSYFLNRTFTFKSDVKLAKSWYRFFLVILICYLFSYQLGLIFAQKLGFKEEVAVLIGSGLYTITNYIGQKRFVFSAKKGEAH